jgi:hypothetical protein
MPTWRISSPPFSNRGVCKANSKPTVSSLAHPAIYRPQFQPSLPGEFATQTPSQQFHRWHTPLYTLLKSPIPARGVCNANSKPTVSPLAHHIPACSISPPGAQKPKTENARTPARGSYHPSPPGGTTSEYASGPKTVAPSSSTARSPSPG